MKITYWIKRAVCALTCSGIILSAPLLSVTQTVSAEDSPYSIVLSAETVELNSSKLPPDRTVDVKLSIENNPGFSEMYIIIQKSSELSFYYPSAPVSAGGKYSGIKNELFDENKDVVCLTVPSYSTNTDNGMFATVKVKLLGEPKPGDFYEIKYLDYFEIPEREISKEAGILKDKTLTGKNSFSQMESGGIRIVGEPVTAPPQDDNSGDQSQNGNDSQEQEQEQQQQQPDQDNNEQQPEQTQPPQNEAETTQVSSSETTTPVTTVPSQNAAVVSGTTIKTTTQEGTSSTTEDDKDDIMASSESIEMKPDKTVETILIVAIIIVSALGVVTFIGLFKYYRKKDQK